MQLFNCLSESITSQIHEIAREDLVYAPAPRQDMGDIALRLFEAAKRLKTAPPKLAKRIIAEVTFGPEVQEVQAAGPYLNFRLNRSIFMRRIVSDILEKGNRYGSNNTGADQHALVEHTSINPNASPHVGRARNAMIGDSLVRLLRFEAYDVEVHYYVNDMGKQIGLLVLEMEARVGDLTKGVPSEISFDEVLQMYVDANRHGEDDPEFASRGYDLLVKMEQNDPKTKASFYAVTDMCLKGQLAVLARLGIRYDVFDRESDYVKDTRLDEVVASLRSHEAVFVDEENRLVVDMSKLGHEYEEGRYFVLMRANGSSMYGYRDLAYNIDKIEKKKDLNIVVLGEDHKLYQKQLSLILEAFQRCAPEVVYYAYIILKEGKMSTREGKVVLLSDFLDEATQRAAAKVEEQCHDLPPDEQQEIAEKVAIAAVRFAILRVSANKNVTFDWESSLSFTGDTGPYVQYSSARIASILRKYGELSAETSSDFPTDTDSEWALGLKLAEFSDIVLIALEQRSCAPIAQYALDVARLFTTFYHACSVLDAPTPEHRLARAQLCAATRQTLTNALRLLGIDAVERM